MQRLIKKLFHIKQNINLHDKNETNKKNRADAQKIIKFTSLPPFLFEFSLAVAFFQLSNQSKNHLHSQLRSFVDRTNSKAHRQDMHLNFSPDVGDLFGVLLQSTYF